MAHQNNYCDPPQHGSKPGARLQVDVAWGPSAPQGGYPMQLTNSGTSSRSAMTGYSNASSPISNSSPNTEYAAMSSDGNSPASFPYANYDNNYTTTAYTVDTTSYGSYNSPTPSATPRFEHNPQTRDTPSSLGWLLDTDLLKLYKFVMGKGREEHHFELLPPWTVTPQTPSRVYLDPPDNHLKCAYPCQFPVTCGRSDHPFNRPADLDRHYGNVHAPPEERKKFECDYPKCTRSKDPFNRKDHYRDHIRDYHKEDIGRAKIGKTGKHLKERKSEKSQKEWLEERKIDPNWWRCAKCLIKINIHKKGWECPSCKQACKPERIAARSPKIEDTAQFEQYQYTDACSTCSSSGWVDDGNGTEAGGWAACPNCQAPATFSREDSHYDYNSSDFNTYPSA